MSGTWRFAAVAAALVGVSVLAFAAWSVARPPFVVAVGTAIRHDDFTYTVTDIRSHHQPDGSTHYAVAIAIRNEAKRVNYQWRDGIAYVRAFDRAGFGHNIGSATSGAFVLAPGEARTARLVFRVPRDLSSAAIHFWDGLFLGDVFSGGAYAKAIVPLGAYHPPIGT